MSAPPPSLPAGSVAAVAAGPAYAVANALSYLFNPLVLPAVGFGLSLAHLGAPAGEITLVVLIGITFYGLLPLAYIAWLVQRGGASSLEVRQREARTGPFLVGIGCYALGTVALGLFGQTAVPVMVAMGALFPINTALVLLINTRWKMSVHLTSVAGFASMLLVVVTAVWAEGSGITVGTRGLTAAAVAPFFALVPMMMWARVRSGAHTKAQTVAGALFGLLVPSAELLVLFRVLGLTA